MSPALLRLKYYSTFIYLVIYVTESQIKPPRKLRKCSQKTYRLMRRPRKNRPRDTECFIIFFCSVPVNPKRVGDGKILRNKIQLILPRRKSGNLKSNDGGALMHTFGEAASWSGGKYNNTKEEVEEGAAATHRVPRPVVSQMSADSKRSVFPHPTKSPGSESCICIRLWFHMQLTPNDGSC